ncbi:uncharacterized protein LOC100480232 isoform X3 [Ailuropoda melanoleuca]|uniref:uncharacterized protein LOC100480232 isoform X3 n=1 Tax=Ailuropoda melanoleuca TaxID=9646 RepID=UPI001493E95E|nr:uncharacterized protein LOC100480232 isoform X3 [Ailuropoda melanoleuca]
MLLVDYLFVVVLLVGSRDTRHLSNFSRPLSVDSYPEMHGHGGYDSDFSDDEHGGRSNKRKKRTVEDDLLLKKPFQKEKHGKVAHKQVAAELLDREEARNRRFHLIAMDAYQRHTKFVNDYILYYGGKKEDFRRLGVHSGFSSWLWWFNTICIIEASTKGEWMPYPLNLLCSSSVYKCLIYLFIYLFNYYYFLIYLRDREQSREEREKHGSIPARWDHDSSRRQTLNRLSHPDAPIWKLFLEVYVQGCLGGSVVKRLCSA